MHALRSRAHTLTAAVWDSLGPIPVAVRDEEEVADGEDGGEDD